jgi:short-subunit dehydrogenase
LSSLQKIYEYVAAADLQIEYLVNNAGFGDFGDFVESELERSRQMISLNVETPVALTWHFAGEMHKLGRGKILNTASIAAFQPVPNMAIYGATKAFLLSFTEALRYELRKSGISVTALCPGPTDTGFFTRARSPFVRMQRSMTTPQQVALSGYRAMKRGKMYIIPGFSNKIMGFFAQVIPCNKMVLQLAAKMTEKV